MSPTPEPSVEDLVRQQLDLAKVDSRLGLAAAGLAEVPDDLSSDELAKFAYGYIGALAGIAISLGSEVDELRARVAALGG